MSPRPGQQAGPPTSMLRSGTVGRLYLALLVVWALLPVLWMGRLAQDGLSLHVAASIVRTHPEDVYVGDQGGLFEVAPAFEAEGCRTFATAEECDQYLVAYVSTPLALPLIFPLGALDVDPAMLLLRAVAAACLVAGMALVWQRLAGVDPSAPTLLLVTAVALTPLATAPVNLGQTSPLLFLSAIVGLGATDTARSWWRAALWAATIAFKVFPAALGAVLVLGRRWRLLAMTALVLAVLAALAAALAPASLWQDFVHASSSLSEQTAPNPYNGSIEATLYRLADVEGDALHPLVLAVRGTLAIGVGLLVWRLRDDDERWAVGWLGLVALMPQTWWHYAWVALAALVVVLDHRRDAARWLWLLPAFAVVSLPLSVANSRGWSVPAAQLGLQLAVLLAIAAITARPPEVAPVPDDHVLEAR